MICAIPPGDCDPAYDEPEPICECGALLECNLLNEWFCAACEAKEKE